MPVSELFLPSGMPSVPNSTQFRLPGACGSSRAVNCCLALAPGFPQARQADVSVGRLCRASCAGCFCPLRIQVELSEASGRVSVRSDCCRGGGMGCPRGNAGCTRQRRGGVFTAAAEGRFPCKLAEAADRSRGSLAGICRRRQTSAPKRAVQGTALGHRSSDVSGKHPGEENFGAVCRRHLRQYSQVFVAPAMHEAHKAFPVQIAEGDLSIPIAMPFLNALAVSCCRFSSAPQMR